MLELELARRVLRPLSGARRGGSGVGLIHTLARRGAHALRQRIGHVALLCSRQRWIRAWAPNISRTAAASALLPSITTSRVRSALSPRSIRLLSSARQAPAFSVAPSYNPSTQVLPSRSIPNATNTTCCPKWTPSSISTGHGTPARLRLCDSLSLCSVWLTKRWLTTLRWTPRNRTYTGSASSERA